MFNGAPPPACAHGDFHMPRPYAEAIEIQSLVARPPTPRLLARRRAAEARLGTKLTLFIDDGIDPRPLSEYRARTLADGALYYDVRCEALTCRYRAGFVATGSREARQGRLFLGEMLTIEARNEAALARAQRRISFRYSCDGKTFSVPLVDLEPR